MPLDRPDGVEPGDPGDKMGRAGGADDSYPGDCRRRQFGADDRPSPDRRVLGKPADETGHVAVLAAGVVAPADPARHGHPHDYRRTGAVTEESGLPAQDA